jgi:L-lactate dehydrogenase complex protein LldE
MAMADLLERAGCQVDLSEDQTCCGQPALNSGYRSEARTVARRRGLVN